MFKELNITILQNYKILLYIKQSGGEGMQFGVMTTNAL